MTVGSELRQARERAGLSAEDISERTKIHLYKIHALENDDFELLPQGIYLDGIVRAYAHEVSADSERMVERVRLQRGKLPGDWEVPFAAPIDLHPASASNDARVLEVPDAATALDAFAREEDLALFPGADNVRHAPDEQDELPPPHMPQPRRRRSNVAVPAFLVLLAVIALGGYWFQTNRGLERAPTDDVPAVPTATAPDNTPAASADGQRSDAPVAFSENAVSPDSNSERRRSDVTASTAPASAVPRDTARGTSGRPPAATTPSQSTPNAPAENTAARSFPDVSGSWKLDTRVESSSLGRFQGLELGYEMQLEQNGARVTGVGRKIAENGGGIGSRAQTPISVDGTMSGDRLTLRFTERGLRRSTEGKFVLLLEEDGTLRGRFSSNAARSSGRVEAHRVARQ